VDECKPLVVGMVMRLNEEAVWGLASMSSVQDNWDGIHEVSRCRLTLSNPIESAWN